MVNFIKLLPVKNLHKNLSYFTGGNCELPPTTIKVGRKLVLNQTNLRCKACWLNSCIKNYNLPNHLKQQLTGVLLPKKAEDSSETFDGKFIVEVYITMRLFC